MVHIAVGIATAVMDGLLQVEIAQKQDRMHFIKRAEMQNNCMMKKMLTFVRHVLGCHSTKRT